MPINKRIFGTPISGKVRKELEKRQAQTGEIPFGSSLTLGGTTKDGAKLSQYNELHSRTPFVRMWTSLKLIDPEIIKEAQKRVITKEEIQSDYGGSIQEAVRSLKKKAEDGYGVEYITSDVYEPSPSDGTVIVREKGARDKIDYARKIYVIGNHNYQNTYSSNNTNDSLETNDPSFSSKSFMFDAIDGSATLGGLFRQELKKNKFLKPQAGITSLNIQTMGAIGAIKKTTVNFIVHNFNDFDDIFNKYFLKPGATIFVDYGWSTVENLYEPKKLIDSVNSPGGVQKFLYADTEDNDDFDGEITKHESDLDVIQGIVSDYNAKILSNGSVECSVTLLSSNSAILGTKPPPDYISHIKTILTKGILFYGVTDFIKDRYGASSPELSDYYSSPNYDSSITNEDAYDKKIEKKAFGTFSYDNLPKGEAVKRGLYINSLNKSDVYITWGLFEDLIINTQFGFGKDKNEINRGNNFQVRLDSSNAFTTWSKTKAESQKARLRDNQAENPLWVYPEWWGDGGGETGDGIAYQTDASPGSVSYSHKEEKIPIRRDVIRNPDSIGTQTVWYNDSNKGRIPIREIFVHTKMIIEVFEENPFENLTKIIKIILKRLNDDESGIFEWMIKAGQVDSQLQIADNKYIEQENRQKYEDSTTQEQDKLFFKFNIMSKNSFVKDYNLELKLPSGELGNYYALQALSHDGALVKVRKDFTTALNNIYSLNANQLAIIYEPDNGGYRAEQSAQENKNSEGFNVYNTMKDLVGRETVQEVHNEYVSSDPESDDEAGGVEPEVVINTQLLERITSKNEDIEKTLGTSHSDTFVNYFDGVVYEDEVEPNQSVLLPYFLTLSIYGISSIQVGDTFQVDYLPRDHLNNSYLQTMSITHNIDTTGWYTTLETQYRNHFIKSPDISEEEEPVKPTTKLNIRLAARSIVSRGLIDGSFYLKNGRVYDKKASADVFKSNYLQAFMTDVTVKNNFWTDFESHPFAGKGYKVELSGHIVKFRTPGALSSNPNLFLEPELNKINGIMFQSLYAEFGYTDVNDKKLKIYVDDKAFRNGFKWTKNSNLPNQGGAYGVLGGFVGGLKDPHIEACTTNPFFFCDPKYYFKKIKRKTYIEFYKKDNKPDDYNFQTRVYPPAVEFKPNQTYTMIIMPNNRYAIFQDSLFSNTDLNLMIKTFSSVGAEVKPGSI